MATMKYSAKITLFSSYFDEYDRLSAKSILRLFQDVAGVNGDEIGVGYLTLLEKNLYWILTRIKFDVLEMPLPNQTVYVSTWPHEKGRIDFDRDFKIESEDGKTMIIGTSKWCVIDTNSGTLQRTENVNYNCEICPDKNYEVQIWVDQVKHVKICAECGRHGKCLKGVKLDCRRPHFDDECDNMEPHFDDEKNHQKHDDIFEKDCK